MPYTKRPAGGIKIEVANGGGLDWLGPWTDIDGITGDPTLPGFSPSKVDITTHNDILALGAVKQNGAGISDVTDLQFDVLLDPDHAGHQQIITDAKARTVKQYRITVPGVTRKDGIEGQISITRRAPMNGYLMATCTVLANKLNDNVA